MGDLCGMKTFLVEQQINNLRPAVQSDYAPHFHNGLLAGATGLVILSILLWHSVPLMIATFPAIVGIFKRRAGPNIAAVINAYDMNGPTLGNVSVTISRWDTDKHYHAVVREHCQHDWEYEFIPQGWEPAIGRFVVRFWRADIDYHPVLTAGKSGILVPRDNPTNPDP
jgi:hypothetical protein